MHCETTSSGITIPTRSTASQGDYRHRKPGPGPILYGLPCANCRLYLLHGRTCGVSDLQLRRSYFTSNRNRPFRGEAIRGLPSHVRGPGPTFQSLLWHSSDRFLRLLTVVLVEYQQSCTVPLKTLPEILVMSDEESIRRVMLPDSCLPIRLQADSVA